MEYRAQPFDEIFPIHSRFVRIGGRRPHMRLRRFRRGKGFEPESAHPRILSQARFGLGA
jgi:hypothetical protein